MGDNKFINRARVLGRMKALPVAVRIAARESLDKRAAFLVEAIRPRVPRDQGDLAESLEWHRSPRSDRITVVVTEGVTDDPEKKRKARAVEFGRPDMAAQPHFYPTYRANKKKMRRDVFADIRKAIKKVVS
jgi:HK97 gp10 family phage protein